MVKTKKYLVLFLVVVMALQTVIPAFAAKTTDFIDFPVDSWSTEAMTAAVENGLITGTSDTKIEPNKNLTRAEFAAIVTRAFGATEKADIAKFADVKRGDWYYDAVAKAVQMGIMNGTGETTFAPGANIKREDVILAMARVLFVDGEDSSVLNQFSDRDKIDSWSVKAIAGMVNEGYIHGYEDGTIRPQKFITRAELAQMFHNIFKTYISEEGTYEKVASAGSVIVRSKGVTLKNVTINGDLVMADGIGDGDFRLENVTVKGKILARGGEGTVYFVNVKSEGKVIINDPNGTVNFHNYRDEVPFVDNLIENTPATFLERQKEEDKPSYTPGGGGVTTKYDLKFYNEDEITVINGITGKKSSYVVTEEDVPTDEAMTKDGFTFHGWTKKNSSDVKDRDYFVGKKISVVKGSWYPYYVEDLATYTISFKGNDDSELGTIDKTEGDTITLGEIPVVTYDEESQEFLGWSADKNDTEADFTNEQITADKVENVFGSTEVTLYPVIKNKTAYTVTFKNEDDTDRASLTKYNPEYIIKATDGIPTDAEMEKTGFVFKGWSTDVAATEGKMREDFLGQEISAVVGTYYPIYEEIIVTPPEEYTVTFYDEDGVAGTPVVKLETESLASSDVPVVTPTDANKKFVGWTTTEGSDAVNFTSADLTADTVASVFGTTTTVNLYPVIVDVDKVAYKTEYYFENQDTTYSLVFTTTLYDFPNASVTAQALEAIPEGYEENVEHSDRVVSATVKADGTTVLKVYYSLIVVTPPPAPTYTLTFRNEADTADVKVVGPVEDRLLTTSDVPADADMEKTGFTFLGWNKDKDATTGKKADYFVGRNLSVVAGTYYPIYEEIIVTPPTEYTITFHAEDGTAFTPSLTKLETESIVASEIPAITPALATQKFVGWTTTEGSDVVNFTSADLTADTVASVFGTTTTVNLYPVIVDKDKVVFKTEYYFEMSGGAYENSLTTERYAIPETTVNAILLDPIPEGYEENVEHSDRVVSATVKADGTTVLKVYYSLIVVTPPPAPTYTLTFRNEADTADVKVVGPVEDRLLTTSDVPADAEMEKTGFTFLGWNKDKDAVTGKKADYFVDRSLSVVAGTYYPIYSEIFDEYEIVFKNNDDSILATINKIEGETIVQSEIPAVSFDSEKQEFLGWSTTKNDTEADLTNSAITSGKVETIFGAQNVTLYPVIKDKQAYTVTFKNEDDTDKLVLTKYDSAYVLTATDVPADAEMDKTDFTFLGWSTDKNADSGLKNADFVGMTMADVDGKVYYPIYEEILDAYEIIFKNADGSDLAIVNKVEREKVVTSEIPTPAYDAESQTFEGWTTTEGSDVVTFTNEQLTADVVENVFGSTSVTLYAVIKNKTAYTVTFKNEDDTDRASLTKYNPEYIIKATDGIPTDAEMEKTGFVFKGWSTDVEATEGKMREDFLGQEISTVVGTYYPIYEEIIVTPPEEYTVTFYDEDGVAGTPVVKLETESLASSDVPVVTPTDANKKFVGWTTTEGSDAVNFTSADLTADTVASVFGTTTTVNLYPVIVDVDKVAYKTEYYFENQDTTYSLVFTTTLYDFPNASVTAQALEAIPEGYEENVEHSDRVVSATVKADGTTVLKVYYSLIVVTPPPAPTYTLTFRNEADTADVKVVGPVEDRLLTTSDVPADAEMEKTGFTFLGWNKDKDAATGKKADYFVGRNLSVVADTYYPIYEEIIVTPPTEYTITFHAEDGTAFTPSLTKLETESIVASEIPAITPALATQKFVGWTTTQGSTTVEFENTDLTADVVANVFGTTTVDLYPVIVDNDTVAYKTEYYFEQLDGTYAIDAAFTVTDYAVEGTNVTAKALSTIPEGFEETDHDDEVESATVVAPDGTTILKRYYARKVITVEYFDLAYDDTTAQLTYEVKYGGTIDNFVDPADAEKTNEEIKQEIADYIEYLVYFGYGKDYDNKYLYNEFEDKLGGSYYNEPGLNGKYEHELNYNWYVEDADVSLGYSLFDETHVFTEDLDLYAKVKRMRIEINLPKSFAGIDIPAIGRTISLLTPFEDTTRALDNLRDMLVMNKDFITTGIDNTELEPKLYDKLAGFEFRGSSFINDERELIETDILFYFYELMGGKDSLKSWLWGNVEAGIVEAMQYPEVIDAYWHVRNALPNDETALRKVFEEGALEPYGVTAIEALAIEKYEAAKLFIYQATETDSFDVTATNEFIIEDVYEKIDSLRSFDDMLNEFAGGRIPQGLMNRLPMDIAKNVYEPRVERFLDELTVARVAGHGTVDSGILFDINTGKEILEPFFAWMNDTYDDGVAKITSSDNRVAELANQYFIENPYATGIADGYLEFDKFFSDDDGDGFYNVKSFSELYADVIMPLSVESGDATLWYFENVDFAKVKSVLEDNEDIILAVTNHINTMMSDYAKNGLPETMSDYYDDLISDPDVYEAIQKIDNKVSFEMMNFVETKIQNATLQTLYANVLSRAGIPAEAVLSKYTGSGAYKTYTHSDFVNYIEELEKAWETSEDGVVNYNTTTDYVFDKAADRIGDDDNTISVTYGGFNITVERDIVNDLYE